MASKRTITRLLTCFAVLGLLLLPCLAFAQPNQDNILDGVAKLYEVGLKAKSAELNGYAQRIFLGLAIIGLVWNCGFLLLEQAEIGVFFATFIRWMIFVGFFWWLTQNGPAMATAIVDSFGKMGAAVSGVESIGPSTPIDMAMMVNTTVQKEISIWRPIDSLGLVILDLVIIIMMCVVAANMLITLCTCWILIYAGQVLLGFGAVKWTSDIAKTYFRTVLGIGVTYMTMLILCGVGLDFFQQMVDKFKVADVSYQQMFILIIASTVLAFLVHKIPPLVGAITGNNGGAHGQLGVGTALEALAVAGAALFTGGASVAAGGIKAVLAATQVGRATAGEGSSGDLGGGSGGSIADAAGSAANNSNEGSALASAMGGGNSAGGGNSTAAGAVLRGVGSAAANLGGAALRVLDSAVGGAGFTGGHGGSSGAPGSGSSGAGSARGATASGAGSARGTTDSGESSSAEGSGDDMPADVGDADSASVSSGGSSAASGGRGGVQRAASSAGGAASSLASGVGSQTSRRVADLNNRTQTSIDTQAWINNPMGGRLAAGSRGRRPVGRGTASDPGVARVEDQATPEFDGDDIFAAGDNVDPAAEIAAFRDRGAASV